MNRQMAHYHPNLNEPCAHHQARWQDSLPLVRSDGGDIYEQDWNGIDWLVMVAAGVIIAVVLALFAVLVLAWA